jgi:hypothetical protein
MLGIRVTVASPSGPADPQQIQPDLGTAMDYNGDGRADIFLHDVYGASNTWLVLLAQKGGGSCVCDQQWRG